MGGRGLGSGSTRKTYNSGRFERHRRREGEHKGGGGGCGQVGQIGTVRIMLLKCGWVKSGDREGGVGWGGVRAQGYARSGGSLG